MFKKLSAISYIFVKTFDWASISSMPISSKKNTFFISSTVSTRVSVCAKKQLLLLNEHSTMMTFLVYHLDYKWKKNYHNNLELGLNDFFKLNFVGNKGDRMWRFPVVLFVFSPSTRTCHKKHTFKTHLENKQLFLIFQVSQTYTKYIM